MPDPMSKERLAEIDKLLESLADLPTDEVMWSIGAARDLRAEVEWLRKQADWYETRCINYGTFVSERDATIERLKLVVECSKAAEAACAAFETYEDMPSYRSNCDRLKAHSAAVLLLNKWCNAQDAAAAELQPNGERYGEENKET